MRKSALGVVVVGVAASLLLGACSSSKKDSGGSSTTPSTGSSNTSASAGKGKVGVILPDTTSSTRYTQYDAPLLTAAFKAAGITPDVQNAQGDKNKFASIAQSMIGEGVKVLIIDSIDAASGAGVEQQAAAPGAPVIHHH